MTSAQTPEALYHQLGQLLADIPDLRAVDDNNYITAESMTWLARVSAIAHQAEPIGMNAAAIDVGGDFLVKNMSRVDQVQKIMLAIHRIMAMLELKIPANAKGAFISAGEQFDAFAAIAKLLGEAKADVLIIDPYMDAHTLVDFGALVADGIHLRLLTDEASFKPTLETAAQKYIGQHDTARPLAIKIAPARSLHDRLIILDGSTAWILTQSLKDFAKRAHGSIQRADDELATMKIAAFNSIWNNSADLAKTF